MANEMWDETIRDAQNAWHWSNISEADKLVMLSISREYVLERWRSAALVYHADSQGNLIEAAIGIVSPILDNFGNLAKRQMAPQVISEWKPWNTIELRVSIECELWCEAFAYCRSELFRRGKPCPEYDWHTLRLIQADIKRKEELVRTQGIQALLREDNLTVSKSFMHQQMQKATVDTNCVSPEPFQHYLGPFMPPGFEGIEGPRRGVDVLAQHQPQTRMNKFDRTAFEIIEANSPLVPLIGK